MIPAMAKYRVRKTLIVHATVDVIVEADSADDADAAASQQVPSNIGTAYPDAGWKARVEITPPAGVEVVSRKLKTTWIDSTDGTKPRQLPADAA
jgi:hypothetical protein